MVMFGCRPKNHPYEEFVEEVRKYRMEHGIVDNTSENATQIDSSINRF